MLLSAVEVLCNELLYFLVVVFDVLAQSTVVECLQLVDDTVNHCRAEYSVFLEYLSVFLKAFSRSSTAVWQLLQCCYAVSVFCIVDVIGKDFGGRPARYRNGIQSTSVLRHTGSHHSLSA